MGQNIMSSRTLRQLSVCALCAWGGLLIGCPNEVTLPDIHGFEPVAKELQKDLAPASPALPEGVQKEAARRRVENMRTAFVQADETSCKADDDCTLTAQHCCGCAEGGRRVAVARTSFSKVIQRRSAVCEDQQCRQVVSDDVSCSATKAKCEAGRCIVDLASVTAAPKGIGVEPINDKKQNQK